jgi:hypothetical protein
MGERKNLVEMMGTMESLKLFEKGDYLVLYVDMETYERKEAYGYLWRKFNCPQPREPEKA